jgi:ribosome-binding ATPase YchF (GTP1/OBG family)
MKIFNFGFNFTPKKCNYESSEFKQLVDKFSPSKRNPYIVEFIDTDLEKSDAVVINKDKLLDFVLIDLEKIEQRLSRTQDQKEKEILEEAQKYLESEKVLSRCDLETEKLDFLKNIQLVSLKPIVIKDDFQGEDQQVQTVIKEVMDAAGRILFFTASNKEVKAWDLKEGKTILEAAGRIHSDLMRGFIRAEVVNCKNLEDFYNMAEAKSKGLVQTVGKDYVIQAGDIIYVKFSV